MTRVFGKSSESPPPPFPDPVGVSKYLPTFSPRTARMMTISSIALIAIGTVGLVLSSLGLVASIAFSLKIISVLCLTGGMLLLALRLAARVDQPQVIKANDAVSRPSQQTIPEGEILQIEFSSEDNDGSSNQLKQDDAAVIVTVDDPSTPSSIVEWVDEEEETSIVVTRSPNDSSTSSSTVGIGDNDDIYGGIPHELRPSREVEDMLSRYSPDQAKLMRRQYVQQALRHASIGSDSFLTKSKYAFGASIFPHVGVSILSHKYGICLDYAEKFIDLENLLEFKRQLSNRRAEASSSSSSSSTSTSSREWTISDIENLIRKDNTNVDDEQRLHDVLAKFCAGNMARKRTCIKLLLEHFVAEINKLLTRAGKASRSCGLFSKISQFWKLAGKDLHPDNNNMFDVWFKEAVNKRDNFWRRVFIVMGYTAEDAADGFIKKIQEDLGPEPW